MNTSKNILTNFQNGESVSKGLQLTVVKPKQTGKVSNPDDLYVDTTLMRKLEQVWAFIR